MSSCSDENGSESLSFWIYFRKWKVSAEIFFLKVWETKTNSEFFSQKQIHKARYSLEIFWKRIWIF